MESSKQKDIAAKAIKKLFVAGMGAGATALTGGNPVVGVVTGAVTSATLDVLTERHPADARLKELARDVELRFARQESISLYEILETATGVSVGVKSDLELLAKAVKDPDGAQRHEVLLQAMIKTFERYNTTSDKLDELEYAVLEGLKNHEVRISTLESNVDEIKAEGSATASSRGEFHGKIDQAKSFIRQGQPDVAIDRLNEVKKCDWDKLNDREKYRVYANLGHAYVAKDEHNKSVEYFLEASSYQKNEIDGIAHRAYGTWLKGDSAEARNIIKDIISEDRSDKIAWFVWLKTTPPDLSIDLILEKMPDSIRTDGDCAHAIAYLASDRHNWVCAEEYARIALKDADDIAVFHDTLATILIESEKRNATILEAEIPEFKNPERLKEAEALLTRALELRSTDSHKASTLLNRYLCRRYLGDIEGSNDDLHAARTYGAESPHIQYQYAVYLAENGKLSDAIQVVSSLPKDERPETAMFMLASLLGERATNNDLAQALEYLTSALDSNEIHSPHLYVDAVIMILILHLEAGHTGITVLNDLIQRYATGSAPKSLEHILSGSVPSRL